MMGMPQSSANTSTRAPVLFFTKSQMSNGSVNVTTLASLS